MCARVTVRWSIILTGVSLMSQSIKEQTMDTITTMVFVGAALLPLPGSDAPPDTVTQCTMLGRAPME